MLELFANPRVFPCIVGPLLAPTAIPFSGVSVRWRAAILASFVVVLIVIAQRVRQSKLEKPAKIWRGTPGVTFVIDVVMVLVAALGIFYATQPWRPEFEVEQAMLISIGFAAAGCVVSILKGPGWIAQYEQGKGPFKRFIDRSAAWFGVVMYAIFFGPMIGAAVAMPLAIIYLEEIGGAGPAGVSREGWHLLLTLLLAVPAAVGWAYVDLRRRRAKG